MSNINATEERRDLRTPLARARGLGSGKSGTEHFWRQRVTAIALALLVPWLVGLLVSMVGADLAQARATIARPWNAIMLAALAIAMFWHAKLGLQVIVEDYVHTPWLAAVSQLAVIFVCALAGLASVLAVIRISLGA